MRRGVAAIPHAPNERDTLTPRSVPRHSSNRLSSSGLAGAGSSASCAHSLPKAHGVATSIDFQTSRPSVGLVHVVARRPRDRERWLRHLLNTAVAATALVAASPLLLLIAGLIKLTSRGPVLFKQTRVGFQHLRDYGNAKGVGSETITAALPGRRDRVDDVLAEADAVWMRFRVAGTHGGRLYGLAPTGKPVEVPEVGRMRLVDGKWTEAWYFADELGLLLQLDAVDKVLGS